MSYLRKIEWDIIPDNKPKVIRNCPKCGKRTLFLNTEKFRVNANKNLIDIWLIYQCSKCKSTWNMTLYERIKPRDINHEVYEKFLANDKELVDIYGFDISLHNRNKAELLWDSIGYHVNSQELEFSEKENEQEIKISCKYPIQLRVDKLLSQQLNVSRSQIKKFYQNGLIYSLQEEKLLNSKVKDGMKIYLKCSMEQLSQLNGE